MRNKSTEQFEQVVKEHGQGIYRWCKAYYGSGPDLDDLYQEVLINLWKALGSFRGDSKLTTWIYRVTINTALTYRRKKSKVSESETTLEDFQLPIDSTENEEKLLQEARYQLLLSSINKLKPDQRMVIGLFLEDLSYKEIAEIIGKDTNYVGVKISRAKEKLSKLMKP